MSGRVLLRVPRTRRALALLEVAAVIAAAASCSPATAPGAPGPTPVATVPSAPATTPTPAPSAAPPAAPASAAPPVVLPEPWTTCRADADCTVVSLGCCDLTAVSQAHAKDAQRLLGESGRPFCPVKTACPVPPVRCRRGTCVFE